jgi:hypothetical protein
MEESTAQGNRFGLGGREEASTVFSDDDANGETFRLAEGSRRFDGKQFHGWPTHHPARPILQVGIMINTT